MAIDPTSLIPAKPTSDTASLAAWYFGADTLFGYYRKVLLAGCRESIRASATMAGHKLTESRIDDMAHTHPAYLGYLADHLAGRTEWLHYYLKEGGMK
jgi:hypothetical protein